MPVYGVTSTGFARKPYAAILDSIKARARALVGAQLTLDDRDPFGAIIHATAEELDLVWQGLEVAYNAFHPLNAEDFCLFGLGSLTGVEQLSALSGECPGCTLNFDAGKTFVPGSLVAHVDGNPANRWVNRDTVISTTAGDYPGVTFVSEGAGSLYAAPAGSLTVIAQRVSGWNSISNLVDALPGRDAESPDDFRVRREESLAIQGSASTSGIRADVASVEGVLQVRVYENNTDLVVGGLPAHSCRVVVWDGSPSQASNNEIAQAILDSKAAGITAFGSLSGDATDANGNTVSVAFDRVTVVTLYAEVTVTAPAGASAAAIKSAVQARVPTTIGSTLVFIAAKAAPLSVPGVTDVSVFKLDVVDPPLNTSTNLVPTSTQIYLLDSSNIDVVIA